MKEQTFSIFSEETEKVISEAVLKIIFQTQSNVALNGKKRFLKKKEFCKEVGISNNTLSVWIKKGLPVIQVEGISLIDMEDAIKFFNQNKVKEVN